MKVLIRYVAADGQVLNQARVPAEYGTVWRAPLDPSAAALHLVFEVPGTEPPCKVTSEFHSHVLEWLRGDPRIDATEVLEVTGHGSGRDPETGFLRSFGIGVCWRDRSGNQRFQEFGGDTALSLLCWIIAATQGAHGGDG